MHIGMRLLHPAAADHSVSISRQQVQRIFSFSLRSRGDVYRSVPDLSFSAFKSLVLVYGASAVVVSRCRVGCTHQAALPPVVLLRPSPLYASAR